jgi:DNA-directed RNA polymerase sigma subunit (sigma70/sigma32)
MRSNRTVNYFAFFIKNIPDLTGKERTVLLSRLRKKTLEAIGGKYNVTEGRVRQIEKYAIGKIKSKSHQLALFGKKMLKD